MLFESRRILLGFRVKLNFDASLKKENSYIFINLSKTPTIRDLLSTIKERFEISREIYITLNDCRLLNSEDNAVLVDVCEVRVIPCRNETNIAPSETSQECEALQRDCSSELHPSTQTIKSNKISERKEILPALVSGSPHDKEHSDSVSCMSEITNRKSRRFYSSIAETIKYLNQNYKLELENTPVLPNNVIKSDDEDHQEKKINTVNGKETVGNAEKSCCLNEFSFTETGDEFVEKRKRKRKRKHSKKPKLESDYNEVIHNTQYADSNMETNTNSSPNKSTRQHIFFEGEDDESANDEERSIVCNLSNDASFRIPSSNKKSRKLENTIEVVENDVDTNVITDITDSCHCPAIAGESFEKKQLVVDSVTESDAVLFTQRFESETKFASERENFHVKRLESENVDSLPTTSVKHQTTPKKCAKLQSKPLLSNGFFSTFNAIANDGKNFQAKEIPSKSPNPLATLLMCKQLQTPVEYSVQFTHPNGISRSRSNSCISAGSNKSNRSNNTAIINQTSAVLTNNCDENVSPLNDDNECEVLCQYKIVGDRVLLSDSNGVWNILSEKDASLKLQPVDEPRENQSLTFQMLYLGPDMCPSMSDLICGKVISFQKDSGRLTLNILPAFIDNLLKSCGEDSCLPDELVHITENAYQISWMAVKNPRLLM